MVGFVIAPHFVLRFFVFGEMRVEGKEDNGFICRMHAVKKVIYQSRE